jgi:hypothetical protein
MSDIPESIQENLSNSGYSIIGIRLVDNETNNVAVVISPGVGAGWSTWNEDIDPCNPYIAAAIILGYDDDKLREVIKYFYPYSYSGGLIYRNHIEWIPSGVEFIVAECDGYESVRFRDNINWRVS